MLDQFLDPLSRWVFQRPYRVDMLAERANEGLLSDDERAEYEALVNAEDFVATLKLKARSQLSDAT